jgi:natural product precursor
MKPKDQRKLRLKKKTIAHLDNHEMKVIYGGTMYDTACIGCTTVMACTAGPKTCMCDTGTGG